MLKLEQVQIDLRTAEMLKLTGLAELGLRNVSELSGGERQRVALARSLAPRPKLLMLDEPMGSLDRALRERLLLDIRSILKRLDMTAIFVTHDQSEAFSVADEIAVMNEGRIVQVAAPEALYLHPKNIFVARFLGFKNLLQGSLTTEGGVKTEIGVFHPPRGKHDERKPVTLLLRPEGARMVKPEQNQTGPGFVHGRVVSRLFIGQSFRVRMVIDQKVELTFDLPNDDPPPFVGEKIMLYLNPKMITVI